MVWTRRVFLKVAGLVAGGAAIGITGTACSDSPPRPRARTRVLERLRSWDLAQIYALSAALFEPADERELHELQTTMHWWSVGRTTQGPHLKLYREGLRALSDVSLPPPSNSFPSLGEAQRREIVSRVMTSPEEGPLKLLIDELLQGYYSSAIGWKSLGYTTWPGVPSAPLEYTTRPPDPTPDLLAHSYAELIG